MDFPERVYTQAEVERARELINEGYRHQIKIKGSPQFQKKVERALELIKTADYYDFLATYIRRIEEIDGLTQLRNADASIWTNKYAVENPVDAASMLIQKATHMKEYLDLTHYYGGEAEKRSNTKRIEFLEKLKAKSQDKNVREECEKLLEFWRESSLVY